MNFKVERPQALTDIVVGRLGDAIMNGELKVGDRLVELDLAQKLGVSRAPLREALRELASNGLIEITAGRGAFVSRPTAQTMKEMGLFRGLVEGAAARLVASRRDPAALERLEALRAEVEQASLHSDHTAFLLLHWKFHRGICVECGNQFILRSWDGVSRLIRLYLQMAVHPPLNDANAIVRNNKAFMHALRQADPGDAECLLRSQIIRVSYQSLGIPVPAEVEGYVSVYVDSKGKVQAWANGQDID